MTKPINIGEKYNLALVVGTNLLDWNRSTVTIEFLPEWNSPTCREFWIPL